jgi:(hydroxyamino)benzene mutase
MRTVGEPETQYFERRIAMAATNRHLMWHGVFLFLLGLVTGLLEQQFTNVRMGLSAHLEGLMNGTFLIALGAIWTEVRLPPWAKATAYWAALYSTYGNWLVTTLAAVFGTAANTPIASAGHSGQPWQESLVAAGFLSVAVVIIACSLLLLWGLWPRALQSNLDVSGLAKGRRR